MHLEGGKTCQSLPCRFTLRSTWLASDIFLGSLVVPWQWSLVQSLVQALEVINSLTSNTRAQNPCLVFTSAATICTSSFSLTEKQDPWENYVLFTARTSATTYGNVKEDFASKCKWIRIFKTSRFPDGDPLVTKNGGKWGFDFFGCGFEQSEFLCV